ncbi:MAG TPA: hypothetical protein VGM54_04795 [Chthoniobacter sp.]|jgi:hypothetical protein
MTHDPACEKEEMPSKSPPAGVEIRQIEKSPELGDMQKIRPMDAVVALYSDGERELTEAIIASLSRAIFSGVDGAPARLAQRAMARVSYRALQWTTSRRERETGTYHNPILERTGHAYARALLDSSSRATECLVEGGDPMNGPYMMIVPEILAVSTTWDRIFLNSVQGRDVQLRFIWETQATYETAKSRLAKGDAVRLKAVAAGTGLSMIVAYDRLVRDGFDPARITARITDRDQASADKANRILAKLASTRECSRDAKSEGGISAGTEDLFEGDLERDATGRGDYDVVTAVGILEYLQGFTCDTTERCLHLPPSEEAVTAQQLVARLVKMTAASGALIVNTCRPHASTRILELFGKRFDYRNRENLAALMATGSFRPARLVGSGNIYDLEVYEKIPATA